MGVPVDMMVEIGRVLTKHGVTILHQDHMNRLIIVLTDMLEFNRNVAVEIGGRDA